MNMSQILTERQQLELNKAILQYLKPICASSGTESTYIELSKLLSPQSFTHTLDKNEDIVDQYLEKKWSSVLRLQKKILDLENEIANIRSLIDLDNLAQNQPIAHSKDRINWLPMTPRYTFETQSIVNTVQLHPVLPLVFCGCADGSIYIWNFASDENTLPEKIIKAHTRSVNRIAFSWTPTKVDDDSNEKSYIFATCSSDLTIKLYNATTYQHLRTLRGHDHTISSISFSPSKDLLFSVSRDKSTKVWNVKEGTCIKSFVGHSDWVRNIDVSTGDYGDFLVTCSNDQSARLSHGQSGTGIAMMIGHSHVIEAVKFLPKVSNSIIDQYVSENTDLFPNLPRDLIKDEVYNKLGFKYCITSSRDNTIKLWLLPPPVIIPGRPPLPSRHNHSQAWLVANMVGHSSWVKTLQVHPNGKYIFSGSDDKTIKIWDLSGLNLAGKVGVIRSLPGHEGFLTDLGFARLSQKKNQAKPLENEEDLLKEIVIRMRCIFVSCATDNLIKIWK
ncbi:LIS1 [Candida oxycetoniae]|uniref:Nuclear distribution protein PAC1 n=1 Tax=Candida oxycetoniae TaxID=497107 RepID=A0AAI9WWB6_9ASCO|nr:LIS1 [Candida oxycetoniae]KAI3402574.2 LIS1 [Candida oxycetoniae]